MPVSRPVSPIRAARALRGINQATLAHDVGISPSTLSAVENGDRTPTEDLVERLATALGCPTESLRGPSAATATRRVSTT